MSDASRCNVVFVYTLQLPCLQAQALQKANEPGPGVARVGTSECRIVPRISFAALPAVLPDLGSPDAKCRRETSVS